MVTRVFRNTFLHFTVYRLYATRFLRDVSILVSRGSTHGGLFVVAGGTSGGVVLFSDLFLLYCCGGGRFVTWGLWDIGTVGGWKRSL